MLDVHVKPERFCLRLLHDEYTDVPSARLWGRVSLSVVRPLRDSEGIGDVEAEVEDAKVAWGFPKFSSRASKDPGG